MDHFAAGDWIDSARSLVTPSKASLMQTHLNAGCSDCMKASQFWRLAVDVSSRESSHCPPNDAVNAVKAAFIPVKPGPWLAEAAQFARLVFDSFKQPSLAMVRGSTQSSRQLVHEAEPFMIDLRLDSDPARKRISLTGQVLNSKNPEQALEGVDVILLSGDQLVQQTSANESGEFDLDFGTRPHLQLFINLRGQRAIGIVLPDLEN